MPNLRDIKDTARSRLHLRMRVETLCYAGGDPAATAETVWLRVNSKDEAVGDLAGTSLAYAERAETVPKLIFLVADHTPVKNNVYMVSATEGYRVDSLEPQDGITVTAVASRLARQEIGQFTPPGA